jgi:hypothetical protein
MKPTQNLSGVMATSMRPDQSAELALFADDDFDLSNKLALNVGLRYAYFFKYGPGVVYQYAARVSKSAEIIMDSTNFKKGKLSINTTDSNLGYP